MKKLIIVANWKSNKTLKEAHSYLTSFLNKDFSSFVHNNPSDVKKEVIICPPSILLAPLKDMLSQIGRDNFSLVLGAQNISQFDDGPYTGEESGRMLKEYASYVIVGHSERRKNFLETDEMLALKVKQANENGIEAIFCVQGIDTYVPPHVRYVAYEPIGAIGSGNPAEIDEVIKVAKKYKDDGIHYFLYGGSVTPENVATYTQSEFIDGVLVGTDSLNPDSFSMIVTNS